MSQIKIDLNQTLVDGMDIKFKAPCDCTAVTGLIIYYPTESDSIENQSFVFKDAHGNILTGLSNLFVKDTYVKVIVDVPNGVAYIQNADTNGYLEEKLASITSNLTAARALVSDGSGKVTASEVTVTELEHLNGVSSNVQEQLNNKANSSHTHSYLPLTGGTLSGQLKVNRIVLTNGTDYGTTLPPAGAMGRIFFKKVSG